LEENILTRLEKEITGFTKSQRQVAHYILCEPMQVAFSTIDKIAHATNVSTTTVLRLTVAMGYAGFTDFQHDLQQHLRTASAPLDKLAINSAEYTMAGDDDDIAVLTGLLIENIRETYNHISKETVHKAAEAIIGARHVYVCGSRSSQVFASYLAFNLDRMFAKADLIDPHPNRLSEIMPRIGKGDVVIVCTLSRYIRSALKVAEYAKRNQATVITVSDSYDSPIAENADCQMIVFCKTNDFHNSFLSPLYLADILIDICSKQAKDEVARNLKRSEGYINDMNVMLRK